MQRGILATIPILLAAQSVAAATITVGPGQSIQSAINGAGTGDEIVVLPGTYNQLVDILGKEITLRSSGGAAVTTLDGTGLGGSVITCDNGEWTGTVIAGFTITGGVGTSNGGNLHGGGLYCRFTSPTVRDCIFVDNSADAGGGISTIGSQSTISGCSFRGNTAAAGGYFGGGGVHLNGGSVKLIDCVFDGNIATGTSKGGGAGLFLGSPMLVNCLFFQNEARHGGGIMNQKAAATITNCTFTENYAVSMGGAMRNLYDQATSTVSNSIFWNNVAEVEGSEILDQAAAITTVNHSDVKGGWTGAGTGNIQSDPMFVSSDEEDCRLSPASPCVDASDTTALPDGIENDLDGNPRIVSVAVDMGAYEAQTVAEATCDADLDGDSVVSFLDLTQLLSLWGVCGGCEADLTGDDVVEFGDLVVMLSTWGDCP